MSPKPFIPPMCWAFPEGWRGDTERGKSVSVCSHSSSYIGDGCEHTESSSANIPSPLQPSRNGRFTCIMEGYSWGLEKAGRELFVVGWAKG